MFLIQTHHLKVCWNKLLFWESEQVTETCWPVCCFVYHINVHCLYILIVTLNVYESPSASVCVYVWDVSHYAGLGVGMCGMWGDVNGDIPGAPSPWTTAENARSMTGGEDRQKREEKRGGQEGRKKGLRKGVGRKRWNDKGKRKQKEENRLFLEDTRERRI